jgi:CHAT domain-containing protein/tetratricopeptide (TPR) repeat protein
MKKLTVCLKRTHLNEAKQIYEKAYLLWKEILGEANKNTFLALYDLTRIARQSGNLHEVLPRVEQSYHVIKNTLGETSEEAYFMMITLGSIYANLGYLDKALFLLEQAYVGVQKLKNKKLSLLLSFFSGASLISTYSALGRSEATFFNHFLQAMFIAQNPEFKTQNLELYNWLTKIKKHESIKQKSSDMFRSEALGKQHTNSIITLKNRVEKKYIHIIEQFQKMSKSVYEEFYEEADNYKGIYNTTIFKIMAAISLASYSNLLGNSDTALSLYKEAYKLAKKEGDNYYEFLILKSLGNLYRSLDHLKQALHFYEEAYRMLKENKQHPSQLELYNSLAYLYVEIGRIDEAIQLFEQIIVQVEKQRKTGFLSVEDRQTLLARWIHDYFNLSWLYLYSNRSVEEAFRLAEMSKARTLLESITTQLAIQKIALNPTEQQKLRDYQSKLAGLKEQIAQLNQFGKFEENAILNQAKNELLQESADFNRQLMAKYPKYAQLSEVKMVAPGMGAKLIPSDTLFISYLMQDNHLIIFTVDATGHLQAQDLGEILGLEQTLKTYQQLLAQKCTIKQLRRNPNCRPNYYVWFVDGQFVTAKKRPSPGAKKVSRLEEISRYLGQQLLAPIQKQLQQYPRWLISPDAALAQIPFETLILEKQPVIATHEISYVQSLSVLALLKAREQEYQSLTGRKTLLAMGAPRYHLPENQPKTCNQATRAPHIDIETMLSRNINDLQRYQRAFQAKGLTWCNLPGAERELSTLEQLFADEQPRIYKQAQASEAHLQRLNQQQVLTHYRYLVFSAHGYFDAQIPELSVIVLDQLDKTPKVDGFVTVGEWFGYDFKSDLTVLSACQTGKGEILRGEGILGLPYAFYVAGNKNTLMTLWTVQDNSTAEFIHRFFAKLKKGMNQITALTETKREFLSHEDYKRPLFWAPFIFYGI